MPCVSSSGTNVLLPFSRMRTVPLASLTTTVLRISGSGGGAWTVKPAEAGLASAAPPPSTARTKNV